MANPVPAVSHVEQMLESFQPQLRPAERRGLALWVVGPLVVAVAMTMLVVGRGQVTGLLERAPRVEGVPEDTGRETSIAAAERKPAQPHH